MRLTIGHNRMSTNPKTSENQFPTDRDILTALFDAVLSLANRLFPDEQMVVQIKSQADKGQTFVMVGGSSQTHWIKKEKSPNESIVPPL